MPLSLEHASLPHMSEKLWGEYSDNSAAVPNFEQEVLERARNDFGASRINSRQSQQRINQELQNRPNVEDESFKANLSSANPTYGSALTTLGLGAGTGWLLDRAIGGGAKLVGAQHTPTSFLGHAKNMLGGGIIGGAGGYWKLLPLAFLASHYLTQSAVNPKYQRGETGYIGSVADTMSNAGESTRKSMEEANERYGIGALPLHALNALNDPIGATMAVGSKAKDLVFGKSSSFLLAQALD